MERNKQHTGIFGFEGLESSMLFVCLASLAASFYDSRKIVANAVQAFSVRTFYIEKSVVVCNVGFRYILTWGRGLGFAEAMGRDYIFLNKPNPAYLLKATWDEDRVREDLLDTCRACQKHNTPVEFALKDVSTVEDNPKIL
ncbi:MAG: hypothetical protein ACOYI4_06140 [Christensenellales bacterium]|jgi:hypothetical protein